MITRIEAYRYRCFERLELDLCPYQVLVGMNGSGKSTLIDIPVLLGEMLNQRHCSMLVAGFPSVRKLPGTFCLVGLGILAGLPLKR